MSKIIDFVEARLKRETEEPRLVGVSLKAVEQRINRKLANEGQALRRCGRNSRWYHDLGDYYIVDVGTNSILDTHIPFGDLAHGLRVLGPNERVEQGVTA